MPPPNPPSIQGVHAPFLVLPTYYLWQHLWLPRPKTSVAAGGTAAVHPQAEDTSSGSGSGRILSNSKSSDSSCGGSSGSSKNEGCSIERHHERSHIPIAGESLTPAPRSVPSLSMLAVSKATDSCTPPPPTQLAIAAPNGTTAEAFVEEVWERWKREVIPVTKAFCMVWGPAHVVTFGVCKSVLAYGQIAFVAFDWTANCRARAPGPARPCVAISNVDCARECVCRGIYVFSNVNERA